MDNPGPRERCHEAFTTKACSGAFIISLVLACSLTACSDDAEVRRRPAEVDNCTSVEPVHQAVAIALRNNVAAKRSHTMLKVSSFKLENPHVLGDDGQAIECSARLEFALAVSAPGTTPRVIHLERFAPSYRLIWDTHGIYAYGDIGVSPEDDLILK